MMNGQVDPDGALHSVGAGNRMTLTAVGQLSGNTGSGTFNRSDGCIGRWIAIKRETPPGRRPQAGPRSFRDPPFTGGATAPDLAPYLIRPASLGKVRLISGMQMISKSPANSASMYGT